MEPGDDQYTQGYLEALRQVRVLTAKYQAEKTEAEQECQRLQALVVELKRRADVLAKTNELLADEVAYYIGR